MIVLLALLIAFGTGLVTGLAGRHGAGWTMAETLASGVGGIVLLAVGTAVAFFYPRALPFLAQSDPLNDIIVLGLMILVPFVGGILGLLPVLAMRRRRLGVA